MLSRFINYPSYQRDPNLFPEYNGFNPKVITHLVKNYRSVPEIVHNFNKLFYNSLLEATVSYSDIIFVYQLQFLHIKCYVDIR